MFGLFNRRRRGRLRSAPFPADWLPILEENVPSYRRLSEAERREVQGSIQVLLAEERFEECGGLALPDEIKVMIAAQACLLLPHRETDYYPRLITILMYPTAFATKAVVPIGGGFVLEGEQGRLGEAWDDGVVVLSWGDFRAGAAWARVLGTEYEQLRRARRRGRDGVLDQYGSPNPT
jgi:MtfA peptidase